MIPAAYYNENDPFAAAWLRELIKAGEIAPGEVDERSIEDVAPDDIRGFRQCHFFAGIGVWSYALRCAGWPDDKPIWTGSCPCQPFSSAGKGGGFDDERHLWPAWHHLIRVCRPAIVFGEQVASKDGLNWFDLVSSDMEGEGYAIGAADLCAAGVGAPHIRQRLWFVAQRLADSLGPRLEGHTGHGDRGDEPRRIGAQQNGSTAAQGAAGGMAEPDRAGLREGCEAPEATRHGDSIGADGRHDRHIRLGPTNGIWRDADWLFCRDGKWRPVRPGSFPLVDGAPARVGRLRGYGNAIVAPVAQAFIETVMEAAA